MPGISCWKSDREEVTVTIRPSPVKPGPGQESVWDYPRPPRLERFVGSITVELGGKTIASTTRAWRVLETSRTPQPVPRRCSCRAAARRKARRWWVCGFGLARSGSARCALPGAAARPPGRCRAARSRDWHSRPLGRSGGPQHGLRRLAGRRRRPGTATPPHRHRREATAEHRYHQAKPRRHADASRHRPSESSRCS